MYAYQILLWTGFPFPKSKPACLDSVSVFLLSYFLYASLSEPSLSGATYSPKVGPLSPLFDFQLIELDHLDHSFYCFRLIETLENF